MWTLQTYSKQKFHLTDKQKEVYIKSIQSGAKMVDFGGFVLSDNFEYLMSDDQEKIEKLRNNPILNDPDAIKYFIEDNYAALSRLENKYPGIKYVEAWDEAKRNRSYLESIE